MLDCFTPESVRGERLVYRPVRGIKRAVKVAGYEETMRTDTGKPDFDDQTLVRQKDILTEIIYQAKQRKRCSDAFLFVSRYVIDRKQS